MFDRIVVGTDGSETAKEAVKTAIELAKLSKAQLEIVSAYEPIPSARLKEEGEGISGDVSHVVNPREDVQFVLDKAARRRQEGEGQGLDPRTRGRPRRRHPRRRRGEGSRPGHGRQQGNDGSQALPARQRPEQDQPPRPLRRLDRPNDLAPKPARGGDAEARSRLCIAGDFGRASAQSLRRLPGQPEQHVPHLRPTATRHRAGPRGRRFSRPGPEPRLSRRPQQFGARDSTAAPASINPDPNRRGS